MVILHEGHPCFWRLETGEARCGKEMNKKSQNEQDSNISSEDSGGTKSSGSSSEDLSRSSHDHPSRSFQNPFQSSYLERLRYPICSPSLFKSTDTVIPATIEETEISSLTSCDIDESDVIYYDDSLDPETEKAAQEAIAKFFEDESTNLFTPDKITNTSPFNPEEAEEAEDHSLRYTCDPSTLEQEIDHSTTWTQTHITFPPNLPEEVEAAIMAVGNQRSREILTLTTCEIYDADSKKHTFESVGNGAQVSKCEAAVIVTGCCCQTTLSFLQKLPESVEAVLSSYETFFEELYTDIRMSMMKRQLFSEKYVPSPQFHSSSPLALLPDYSPLQSGSSVTPQCSAVRTRHHGSPMGDIVSPAGVSPIARPLKTARVLSKLDFVSCSLETVPTIFPPASSPPTGAAFSPSDEDGSPPKF